MNSRKYYLCVTPFFPTPNSFRGPFVYDQVKALKTVSDYEVVVFKPTSLKNKAMSYEYDGIKVFLFPTAQTPSYLFNGLFNGYNAKSFAKTVLSIGINPKEVVAVHCHTSTFGACGLELKKYNPDIKVLLQHHDKDPFTILNGKLAGWRLNSRYRAKKNIEIFNAVDVHVCISRACQANLLAFPQASAEETYQPYLSRLKNLQGLPKIAPKKTVILYNGVDTSKFFKKDTENEHPFTIGCVANFISLKGQEDLIKAFGIFVKKRNASNTKLLFVGSGPTKDDSIALCRQMGIDDRVEFKTEVQHHELIGFFNTLDLFVLPSHFDGFGCVCLEASACGVPFMISKNQGACEYFVPEEEHQWSFLPGDVNRLTEIIDEYYNKRQIQHLKYPIEIKTLVSNFLKEIGL